MDYTSSQRTAIDAVDHHLQIIACAGSGKTRVVTDRIINVLRLHQEDGITPENIVAFTFTEKAAAELKDRITRAYQETFGDVEGIAGMYVGTIHGFCLDMLQRYLYRYLKYDVLDEIKQRLFVDRYSKQSGMSTLEMKRWIDSSLYLRALGVLRETNAVAHLPASHPAIQALTMYQALLDQHRYLDYDEILLRAVTELETNETLQEQIRQRVKYVTVDEYQDVSPVQERLIRQLYQLGANLCVVGDDDQNLYQWRGSDVRHIVEFTTRYDGVLPVSLETNFRSTEAIVKVARRAVEENTLRLAKKMESSGQRGFERGDLLCLKFESLEEEAEWVADKIQAMYRAAYTETNGVTRGLSWSDCAILLRSVRRNAGPIVEALRKRNIPHVVTGMTGLFDTAEAKAAVAIFQFMTQEIGDDELLTHWRDAQVGLSESDLACGIALLKERRTFEPGKRYSTYALERTFLDFLEAAQLRETRIPGDGRGEVVYYNLGKFSQAINDYETIHFKSKPEDKYQAFVEFLRYQAPNYYPEGGQDVAYATPDAVRIMTVHQAKGMEFPVVFLPCLQKNRFPAKRQYNALWKYIPKDAIPGADRYDGTVEDERRLFYVAITRSEKYLFCSWAPDAGNQQYRKPSPFWDELTRREQVLTRDPILGDTIQRLTPTPRRPQINVEMSFSDLKYFFECSYEFKLKLLYGFDAPLDEALGYGRSLHNVLAEVHRRALKGDIVQPTEILGLVERHLNVRYAYPVLEETLRNAAVKATNGYLQEHESELARLEHVEETIQLALPGGVVVNGRIDLIRRTDTGEVAIVDFKSDRRAQAEQISRLQLHVYALGYEQRFGKRADLLEVCNLDAGGSIRELVDDRMMRETADAITRGGQQIRNNQFEQHATWCSACDRCDYVGICRDRAPTTVRTNG